MRAFAIQPANDEALDREALHHEAPHHPGPGVSGNEAHGDESVNAEPSDEEAEGDAREAERHSVLLTARLQCGADTVAVRLRNVSRTGARIESAVLPPVGSIVRFIRGDLAVSARVVWTGQTSLGLEFREAIDDKELLVGIGRSEGASVKPLKALFPSPPAPPAPRSSRLPASGIPKPLH
jgi:hypothetical protein